VDEVGPKQKPAVLLAPVFIKILLRNGRVPPDMSFDSLPQIWANDTPTDAHRKALLRCLIEKVVLDRGERVAAP
jgi:hypothetical protein